MSKVQNRKMQSDLCGKINDVNCCEGMLDSFETGKAWFMYVKLESDFIDTTSYVALDNVHCKVWSEKFAELLTRTGDLIDSFFRLMIDSKSLDGETTIASLKTKIVTEQARDANWFPKIGDFRATFEPIFRLSGVEVEAGYGLTSFGKLYPFKDFDKQSPSWWEPYNKVKHQIFEEMENKATLENSINALAALFALNILHKESQRYLVRNTEVILTEFLRGKQIEQSLNVSFIGSPNNMPAFKFIARTSLFTHVFRVDPNPNKKVGSGQLI